MSTSEFYGISMLIFIRRMFEKFEYEEVIGRSVVTDLLDLKNSSASKLLLNLVQAEIIEPVYGKGNINSRSNLYLI